MNQKVGVIPSGIIFRLTESVTGLPKNTSLRLGNRILDIRSTGTVCVDGVGTRTHWDVPLPLIAPALLASIGLGSVEIVRVLADPAPADTSFPEGTNKLKETTMSQTTNNDVKLSKLSPEDQLLVLNGVMDVDGNPTSYGSQLLAQIQFDAAKTALVKTVKDINKAKKLAATATEATE